MVQTGAFHGRSSYTDALQQTLLDACQGGSRELVCIDANFADWPWSDAAVLDALTPWAKLPGRRLKLLALQFEDMRRLHPRFVRWRMLFDHCIEARAYEMEAGSRLGFAAALLVAGAEQPVSIRLFDTQNWRGTVSDMPAEAVRLREISDALTQRSEPSFSSTTFGL